MYDANLPSTISFWPIVIKLKIMNKNENNNISTMASIDQVFLDPLFTFANTTNHPNAVTPKPAIINPNVIPNNNNNIKLLYVCYDNIIKRHTES